MNMKRIPLIALLLASFVLNTLWADEPERVMKAITAGDIFEIVKVLSSPDMEGRLAGTEGYNRAAKWAASQFEDWGLKPVYKTGFLQPFSVAYNETRNVDFSLLLPPKKAGDDDGTVHLTLFEDYGFTLYSGFGDVETEVIFVGFGISEPDLGWDDYAGVDVRGKIVAFIPGFPNLADQDFSKYRVRQPKMDTADRMGARGIIQLSSAVVSGLGRYMERLPNVMVGEKVADLLFHPKGYDFQTVRKLLGDGHPLTFETGVMARLKVEGQHHPNSETYNVVGMIEGSDPALKEEYILFGGHLDHLGPWPALLPGANDNASGSAVVMALARAFSKLSRPPKRSIVFALFSGEEIGLLGSGYMAAHLPGHPSKPILYSNHDVNGVGAQLHISGGLTFPKLYRHIEAVNAQNAIQPDLTAGEISMSGGNSDYASFTAKGIPAYNTAVRGGSGPGAHSPESTIYTITPKIMEDMVRLYFLATYRYANE